VRRSRLFGAVNRGEGGGGWDGEKGVWQMGGLRGGPELEEEEGGGLREVAGGKEVGLMVKGAEGRRQEREGGAGWEEIGGRGRGTGEAREAEEVGEGDREGGVIGKGLKAGNRWLF